MSQSDKDFVMWVILAVAAVFLVCASIADARKDIRRAIKELRADGSKKEGE